MCLNKKTNYPKKTFWCKFRDLLGASEHILIEGNERLILCERGVVSPHTHRDTSRFMLDIQAIPALKEIVNYPIISDPSHASFWAPWVPSLVYASIAANCDGLIIETHPNLKIKSRPTATSKLQKFSQVIDMSKKISKIFKRKII